MHACMQVVKHQQEKTELYSAGLRYFVHYMMTMVIWLKIPYGTNIPKLTTSSAENYMRLRNSVGTAKWSAF